LIVCELEFAFEQTLAYPVRKTRVRVRPDAVSGTPLLEQEFALQEATVDKELEVRIYLRTSTGNRKKETTNILLNYL